MGLMWLDHDPAAFCHQITERVPSTKVLALSFQNREEDMLIGILARASGYVSQSVERTELVRAIGMVNNGGGYFDWETARRVIERIQEARVMSTRRSAKASMSRRRPPATMSTGC